ncbi:MAG: alpha/beta hydrolase [Steroidobacteraceae bacterium]
MSIDGLFPGFRSQRINALGASNFLLVGGSGPPVLLLHGYPQTHCTWHRVAPELAKQYTVVIPDLRGYGESVAPSDPGLEGFSKATLALDQIAIMEHLGFDRFAVVGHDRGARVGYRLALDHPTRVTGFASLTVVPTLEMWRSVSKAFAMNAYTWFLLAQPYDLPERLIGSDPDFFLNVSLTRMAGGLDKLHPEALENYRAAFRRESVRHAMCEDYRAAAGIDAEKDLADEQVGRRMQCPVLILWAEHQVASGQPTPLHVWKRWADDVRGVPVRSGHLMPEEAPEAVLSELIPFLASLPR